MTKHPITAHRGKRMEEAIVQAALDYVEGWYEADGARMDQMERSGK
jgi:hypothetical protein